MTGANILAAEGEAREAPSAYASTLKWAKTPNLRDPVHQEMDRAATWIRQTFGCTVAREGANYFQCCPVALAHTRVGLSVGG
ncbi:hypothetical protein Pen02_79790 [Plantactinospora endophytica]|uniref:Uncharacterized protein n=1 Tax=Plantactinospora endophytica TaxID=673535 RepID=A0ABQ4EE78_9ACTN|nr:hypothetical protein Pen02_79790 [Plantactinospora endophytica]